MPSTQRDSLETGLALTQQSFRIFKTNTSADIWWLKGRICQGYTHNINRFSWHLLCVNIYESLLRYYDNAILK